jgi:hypothetical protein
MIEREDSMSIAEGLRVWKQWNPNLANRPTFVIDHSLAELNAIRSVWPGIVFVAYYFFRLLISNITSLKFYVNVVY